MEDTMIENLRKNTEKSLEEWIAVSWLKAAYEQA